MKNVVFVLALFLMGSTVWGAAPLAVHVIDVGQGDSIFVQTPDGKTMLVDGGEINGLAEKYLKSIGIEQIDIVVGTHPHLDHLGGLVKIVKTFSVGQVVMPRVTEVTTVTYQQILDTVQSKGMRITEGKAGISLDLGPSVLVECLAPNSNEYKDVNDFSVVLKITYGSISFLLAGDATSVSEQEMLQRFPDKLKSTVLKVGHHGSTTSSSVGFVNTVGAQVAVFSAGKGNDHGHPTKTVWDRLSRSYLFRTDEQGTVILSTDGTLLAAYSPPVNGQYATLAAFQAPTPEMLVAQATPQVSGTSADTLVYVTKNGAKYHRANCRALSGTLTTLTVGDAIGRNYTPCGTCKP